MKKRVIAGLILPWLFISSVFGQKKNLETIVNNPITYEEKKEDDKLGINIIVDYNNKKTKENKTSYAKYESALVRTHTDMTDHFNDEYSIESDFSDVSPSEKTKVGNIFTDIHQIKINSYSEFIEKSKNLEEDTQLMLFCVYSTLLKKSGYSDNKIFLPQEENFSIIMDFLRNDKYGSAGNCGPIIISTEKTGEDNGKDIDGVSGGIHYFNIIDTKKGLAIINYSELIRLYDSYDVEKILKIYQQISGRTSFEHYFFDKGQLKQIWTSENGKRFLEAIKYENPKNFLEETLIFQDKDKNPIMEFEVNQTNYLTSCSPNIMGIFLNMGKINGDSAMKKMFFCQVGYDRNFLIKDKLKLDINSSYIEGQIKELGKKDKDPGKKEYEIAKFPIRGFMADLGVEYYDLYGINIGTKYSFLCLKGDENYKVPAGDKIYIKDDYLAYKNELGIGASYNLQIENFNLKPYLIMNEGFYLDNIKDERLSENFKDYIGKGLFSELGKLSAILMEYGGGISSEVEISLFKIGINPFYFIRQNEKEYGAKGNLEFCLDGKKFGLEGNFSDIKSDYIFNLNKRILGTGVYVQIGNLSIKVRQETETRSDIKNRWLKHEHNYNFNIYYNF